MIKKIYNKNDAFFLGAFGLIFVIFLWETAARLRWVNPALISSPISVLLALLNWARSGALWRDLLTSLLELVVGFGVGAFLGISLGVMMGWKRSVEYGLDPFIWALYATPLVCLWPLFIIWFGIGLKPIIVLAFLFAVVPIAINTFAGVRGVDPTLIRCARSFNAKPVDLLFKFILPGSIPMIIAGLRLGIGRALIGVVIGELFTSNAGLGFHISFYGARLQFSSVFAALFVIVIIGLLTTQSMRLVEGRFERWKS